MQSSLLAPCFPRGVAPLLREENSPRRTYRAKKTSVLRCHARRESDDQGSGGDANFAPSTPSSTPSPSRSPNPLTRRSAALSSAATALLVASAALSPPAALSLSTGTLRYSQFLDLVEEGKVSAVREDAGQRRTRAPSDGASEATSSASSLAPSSRTLEVLTTDGSRYRVVLPPPPPPPLGGDPELLPRLLKAGVRVEAGAGGGGGGGNRKGDEPSLFSPPPSPSSTPASGFAAGAGLAAALLWLVYNSFGSRGQQDQGGGTPSSPSSSPPPPSTGDLGGGFLGGDRNNPLREFMKSRAIKPASTGGATFEDVAGVDAAKGELSEVADFLKNPDKYAGLGARVPRGVLLEGPSGTGKTLLARALAGEAGVPFFSAAGPEFVEIFVGVGAARVRDLFSAARAAAPSIVLIDEIDAVGRVRGSGVGGGSDEREQTINQLLAELDGFDSGGGGSKGSEGGARPPPAVVVLAATNRPDILDPALLRPGRFDRRIRLDLPDLEGRVAILKVHARGKRMGGDVDLRTLARRTPGFSGAALANVLNEAAITAATADRDTVTAADVDGALERVVAGPERRAAAWLSDPSHRRAAAAHEAGHVVVAQLVRDYDAVAKASIIPRGGGGGDFGSTFFVPDESVVSSGVASRARLESQLAVTLAGRASEELVLGEAGATTGGSGDLAAAGRLARAMVESLGYDSSELGPLSWSSDGPPGAAPAGRSSATSDAIDAAVSREIEAAATRARGLLEGNRAFLDAAVEALLERETLSGEDIEMLCEENGGVAEATFVPPSR